MSDARRSASSPRHPLREGQGQSARWTATQAKNEFGRALEIVLKGGRVVITRHQRPIAVLTYVEEFNKSLPVKKATIDTLTEEFDALLARIQTAKAHSAMKAAFAASPKKLGKAAVIAARKRG